MNYFMKKIAVILHEDDHNAMSVSAMENRSIILDKNLLNIL